MPSTLLNFILVANAAAAGGLCGWWLRGYRRGPDSNAEQETEERVNLLVQRLHHLAESVAADVGAHNSRVQKISDELATDDVPSADVVVTAVTELIETNERMQRQLDDAEEKLQEQAEQIASQTEAAMTDALTGLANRRALDFETEQCLHRLREEGEPATVMLLDVDHFKKFNDTYGHQAGDEVLRGVARVLRKTLAKHGCVARYGGEEFAVVFPGQRMEDVVELGERARRDIAAARFRSEDRWLQVTASGGFSELLAGDTVAEFVKRADDGLYASKEAGRDCAHWNDGYGCHLVEISVNEFEDPLEDMAGDTNSQPEEMPSLPADVLKRVSNRADFQQDVNRRLSEWKRGGAPVSVIVVKMPGLVTDVIPLRPALGQLIRRVVAQLTLAVMRDMDHIGNLADDTFAVLLPGSRLEQAVGIAERLLASAARRELLHESETLPLVLHVGVAEALQGDGPQQLLGRAVACVDAGLSPMTNSGRLHDGQTCRGLADRVALTS